MNKLLHNFFLFLSCSFSLLSTPGYAKVIHQEKSLYRNIVVKETDRQRCLVFPSGKQDRNQSCIDIKQPKKLIFPYVRMIFGGLLLNPDPQNILVIGLGGGSIPATFHELFPACHIDAVEIDEAVIRVAKQYFDFSESERLKVFVSDARVFVKRAILKQKKYDFVVLDAFNGDYIPEHLMTMEFLQEVKAITRDRGVVVANTFSSSNLYDHESVTYHQVFGDFFNFQLPVTGNRVILASMNGLPDAKIIQHRVVSLEPALEHFGVHIRKYPRYMRRNRDWNEDTKPLTDQFSPANLLRTN